MIWNENHPEQDEPELRALAWRQAAELASIHPIYAADLLTWYEAAGDAEQATRRALHLEATRAEAAAELRRLVDDREAQRQIEEMADLCLGPLPPQGAERVR